MLARHQLPNGYIWAVCYPEDTCPPADEDYGYYESDIFSAWFVPSLADYLLFTNDCDTADKLWNTAAKSLDYLWQYIENDGLFFQRYQTSKGIWDHCLNDIGKFSYTNIIVYHAFADGAFIANTLGYKEEASIKQIQTRNNALKYYNPICHEHELYEEILSDYISEQKENEYLLEKLFHYNTLVNYGKSYFSHDDLEKVRMDFMSFASHIL